MKKSIYTLKGILSCIFAAIILLASITIAILLSQTLIPGIYTYSDNETVSTIHFHFDGTYSARTEYGGRESVSIGIYSIDENKILLTDTEDNQATLTSSSFYTIKHGSNEFICISLKIFFIFLLIIGCCSILAFAIFVHLAHKEQERLR